jgi:hypothetical protein
MKGQEHFCTFVVDKTGRIAYVGGPLFLGMALAKVLAGDATAKAIGDEMAKVDADYQAVAATLNRDPEAFLPALKDFEAKYPVLADCLPAASIKLHMLIKQGNAEAGKEYTEALVTKAVKQKNAVLLEMVCSQYAIRRKAKNSWLWRCGQPRPLVRIDGGKDAHSLLRLADTYDVSGAKAKAKEYAGKALEAANKDSSTTKDDIEKEARRLGFEK